MKKLFEKRRRFQGRRGPSPAALTDRPVDDRQEQSWH